VPWTCQRVAAAVAAEAARLPRQEPDHQAGDQHQWQDAHEDAQPGRARLCRRLHGNGHALGAQLLDQVGVVGGVGLEKRAVLERADDGGAVDGNALHLALVEGVEELRIGNGLGRCRRVLRLPEIQSGDQQEDADHRDRKVGEAAVYRLVFGHGLVPVKGLPRWRIATGGSLTER
jgi:hypothetical protein